MLLQVGQWRREPWTRGYRNALTGVFIPDAVLQREAFAEIVGHANQHFGEQRALIVAHDMLSEIARKTAVVARYRCGLCMGTGSYEVDEGQQARCLLCRGSGYR